MVNCFERYFSQAAGTKIMFTIVDLQIMLMDITTHLFYLVLVELSCLYIV